jgi:hypothetical protein
MRIILALAALFVLAGCETMDFSTVSVGTTYSTYGHHDHIRYTLGYYTGTYYNGYRVYGDYGHRYYHAPRHYRHHRYYSRPKVIHHHHYHKPKKHYREDRRHNRREHRNEHKREHKRRDHRRDDHRDNRRERHRRK